MEPSAFDTGVTQPRTRFKRLRRLLFGLTAAVTLAALIYAVEDWRGRAAWEKCKREMEAKGLELDWAKLSPVRVPDSDNFFKAPKMQEWFVRKDPKNQLTWKIPFVGGSNPVVVAEVNVILPEGTADAGRADGVWRLDDPQAAQQAQKLILAAIGPQVCGAQGYTFVARPAEEIKPLRIFLRSDKMPSQEQLAEFFSERALAPNDYTPHLTSGLKIQATGSNSFRVELDAAPQSAKAFVTATDVMKPDIELLREALKRPYARMDGDYGAPITMPAPNFVQVRIVSQLFAERAQCNLMLGQPEEALQDLTVIDGLCRMLECRPSGPRTLVGPMINVAVRGLYTMIIGDGLRMGAWHEPQLAALQKQLLEANLPQQVEEGFSAAGAAFCINIETITATQYEKVIKQTSGGHESFWEIASDGGFWFLTAAPRGWRYQNMVCAARAHEKILGAFEGPIGTVDPIKADETWAYLRALSSRSPYTYFTVKLIPNYRRAGWVMAYMQTMANEALIACALERYRVAQGQYPDTLDSLTPHYLGKIPADIIGGKPLIYRRTEEGKFMLYSVGWNMKDEGGLTRRDKSGSIDYEKGDWVWLNCQR